MSRDIKLSVVIPTYNCGVLLSKCLESVKFADEIIVVDMGSSDNTIKVAKSYSAKVVVRKFPKDGNFDWNRYYGMKMANGKWILKLDSDEELSPQLQQELINFVQQNHPENIGGMWLRNKIYIFGKRINHGPVKNDSKELRLYKNGKWKYLPTRYHQQVYVEGNTLISRACFNHFNYRTVSEFVDKTNKYTELDSVVLQSELSFGTSRVVFSFLLTFVKLYVIQRGFLDGKVGLIVCWLYAFYYFIEKIKILEKQKNL